MTLRDLVYLPVFFGLMLLALLSGYVFHVLGTAANDGKRKWPR